MTIGQLQPGDRFRLTESPERTGELLSLSPSSAAVRFDGKVHRHVKVRRGQEVIAEAEFDTPQKSITISLGTSVERISQHKEEKQDVCRI